MQTLRKKTSPLKYKNETTRFLGDGVSFKAKLIGILEVSEARGDRMCQEALSDLKMAIRAAGEHKQRITINIAIDGLRLRDEKTGDSLYHHPVHKISFIAQDMTDSRAFGYIFGSPDTGHRFFGIKTDKAASQVVIAMRDLFQVVFALKKKEIELAKSRYGTATTTSPLFADSALSNVKSITQETTKSTPTNDNKTGGSSNSSNVDTKTTSGGTTAVADLVDLELELNSLQQGLNQMERITPSTTSMVDPFGDSFTTYTKPILPPPPSSGRDRSNRAISDSMTTTATTKSNVLHDLISSSTTVTSSTPLPPPPPPAPVITATTTTTNKSEFNDNDDWFTTTNNLFEEPSVAIVKDQQQQQQASKDDKHELTKKEIMSQFDVFTELDPLGTGRSKPYIDKKHFFQELKNPPKKVLKDLVSQSQQQQQPEPLLFNSTLPEASGNISSATIKSQLPATVTTTNDFTTDPFGEDPFVANDPFADSDFVKQDQFENVEFNDFKKCFDRITNNLNNDLLFDNKQQQQEVSFDVVSETSLECAPEPPPRPTSTIRQQQQIKPPPLPPKKQSNEMLVKPPPPRPIDKDKQPLYEYIYQGAQNNLEFNTINNNNNNSNNGNNNNSVEKTPPLPVPVRKTKFNSDFGNVTVQQSQQQSLEYCTKKQPSIQSSDEDYLTPIDIEQKQVDLNLDDLDITLSQLTLSGLNQLAIKLNIPANQLSNMTLVQLTNYLSNFIKSKTTTIPQQEEQPKTITNDPNEFPAFKADFATNFNDFNSSDTSITTNTTTAYDRYAVFRELIQEEIKQTKIDTEPEELQEEKKEKEKQLLTNLERNEKIITSIAAVTSAITSLTTTTITTTTTTTADKYAALREIVESELKMNTNEQKDNNNDIVDRDNHNEDDEIVKEQNILNKEKCIINDNDDEGNIDKKDKYNLIEYNLEKEEKVSSVIVKSPQQQQQQQNTTDLNSGSLSDIVSGSSPENDNSEQQKLTSTQDSAAGDSWVIFDQNQIVKEKQQQQKQQLPPTATAVTTTHSEEGVSPWSSDSKEFGNGSPPEWRLSGNDRWYKKRNIRQQQQQQQQQQQESWWDTSAEPKVQQFPQSNRRSTDSYDDEYYECYERPRRRKHYSGGGGGGGGGGHSSSSRDVSPWEDEPRSRRWHGGRHMQQFEKLRDRRQTTDSWEDDDEDDDGDDDDDDYDYDRNVRFHNHRRDYEQNRWMDDWDERRYRRGRWCCPDWEQPELARYPSRYPMEPPNIWRGDRYYNRSGESQESPWEDDYSNDVDGISAPAPAPAPLPPAQQQHLNKRNWKRPSSASEMDRKTGEIKSRHYLISGSSDGERERRYKPNRRSRSRDSQYSEPVAGLHRHKSEISGGNLTVRSSHKSRPYFRESSPSHPPPQPHPPSSSSLINRKSATLSRKKIKDESVSVMNTFPRKSTTTQNRSTTKSLFENDFVATPENSPTAAVVEPLATKIADKENQKTATKFKFDHDFEAESPTILLKKKSHYHHHHQQQQHHQSSSPTLKSLFEDDFSPGHNIKSEQKIVEDIGNISSIKEEINDDYDVDDDNGVSGDFNVEEIDSFNTTTTTAAATARTTNPMARKKKFSRFASNGDTMMIMMQQLKKSESVNIFARENDPFDDDFFSETQQEQQSSAATTKTTDLKWTEDLEK